MDARCKALAAVPTALYVPTVTTAAMYRMAAGTPTPKSRFQKSRYGAPHLGRDGAASVKRHRSAT